MARFRRLDRAEQLLAMVDLERSARGLPVFVGLSAQLDGMARAAAIARADPAFAGVDPMLSNGVLVDNWGGNWAGGTFDTLATSYDLMYLDGPGAFNLTCTASAPGGCWDHRDNILARYPAVPGACQGSRVTRVMGAAAVSAGSPARPSFTELFAAACGPVPELAATWRSVERTLRLVGPRRSPHR